MNLPRKNFDLSDFKLTIPDKDATEISKSQLEGGYESDGFYTDSNDKEYDICLCQQMVAYIEYRVSSIKN